MIATHQNTGFGICSQILSCGCRFAVNLIAAECEQPGIHNFATIRQYDGMILAAAKNLDRDTGSDGQFRIILGHTENRQLVAIHSRCHRVGQGIIISGCTVVFHIGIGELLHASGLCDIDKLVIESFLVVSEGAVIEVRSRFSGQRLIHHNGVDVVAFAVQVGNIRVASIGRIRVAQKFAAVSVQVSQTGILDQRAGRDHMRYNVC